MERRNAPPVATPDSADLERAAGHAGSARQRQRPRRRCAAARRAHRADPRADRGQSRRPGDLHATRRLCRQRHASPTRSATGSTATEAAVTVTVTGATPPTYANGYSFRRRLLIPAASVSRDGAHHRLHHAGRRDPGRGQGHVRARATTSGSRPSPAASSITSWTASPAPPAAWWRGCASPRCRRTRPRRSCSTTARPAPRPRPTPSAPGATTWRSGMPVPAPTAPDRAAP